MPINNVIFKSSEGLLKHFNLLGLVLEVSRLDY